MLIIDYFPYNGDPIAITRIKLLYDVVDYFCIVESRFTFTGVRKPYLFYEHYSHEFDPYKNKIMYFVMDRCPEGDAWACEREQRNFIMSQNFLLNMEYILMVSDADEIIRPEVVIDLKRRYNTLHEPHFFRMDFFYYNLSWMKKGKWDKAFCINNKYTGKGLDDIRNQHKSVFIENAGWHLSYFMSAEDISNKINSFSHTELNNETFKSIHHIKSAINSGKDLFDRGVSEDLIQNTDMAFPRVLLEFDAQIRHTQQQ